MNASDFERDYWINVRANDDEGITRTSLERAPEMLNLIKNPKYVYLLYQEDPWDFVTYVVDHSGDAVRFSGFSWGYKGEGPRGLEYLLREYIGWTLPPEQEWPPAHMPGLWIVTPGHCEVA